MARTYKRDSKGRFAGGGGSKDNRGPAKVGRSGPRGGKVGSRAEQKKAAAAQAARSAQFHSKAGSSTAKAAYKAASRGARMSERGAAAAVPKKPTKGAALATRPTVKPARKVEVVDAQVMNPSRPRGQGSMTSALRSTLRELAQSDARFIREIEAITGQKIKVPRNTNTPKPALSGSGGRTGKVSDALRANLRELAQSDARRMREMAEILTPPKLPGGSSSRSVSGGSGKQRALPSSKGRKRKK